MNALAPRQSTAVSTGLMPTSMESAIRLADMMSTGKLVPTHLQKAPGDCLMVIEQSMRWGMSPFAVAQATSVIQGKLMFEGKLVAAAIQSSGILSSRLEYEFEGEGDGRAIVVSATITGETKARSIRLTLKEAKTSNGMWTKQPDQQLVYAGTRVWARRHTPEVMLGVYSPEEMETAPREATPYAGGPTIEAKAEPVRRQTTAQAINDEIPDFDADPLRDKSDWMVKQLAACKTAEKFAQLEASAPRLLTMLDDEGRDDLKQIVVDSLAFHADRFRADDTTDPAAAA